MVVVLTLQAGLALLLRLFKLFQAILQRVRVALLVDCLKAFQFVETQQVAIDDFIRQTKIRRDILLNLGKLGFLGLGWRLDLLAAAGVVVIPIVLGVLVGYPVTISKWHDLVAVLRKQVLTKLNVFIGTDAQ